MIACLVSPCVGGGPADGRTLATATVTEADRDGDGVSDATESMLIARHAPYYYFDSKEEHWPAGALWYAQRCALKLTHPGSPSERCYWAQETVLPRTSSDPNKPTTGTHPELILQKVFEGPPNCDQCPPQAPGLPVCLSTASNILCTHDFLNRTRYSLDPPDESWVYRGEASEFLDANGDPHVPNRLNIGLYAHVLRYPNTSTIIIQYLQFFAKNNIYGSRADQGWHEGDWLYLEVYVNDLPASNYPISQIVYHHHGDGTCDASRVLPSACFGLCGGTSGYYTVQIANIADALVPGTQHPRCYIEAGSHEWYPYPATNESCAKYLGQGDFIHRGNGLQYQTADIPNLGEVGSPLPDASGAIPLENELVLLYSGLWGDDGGFAVGDPPPGPVFMEGVHANNLFDPHKFWTTGPSYPPAAATLRSPGDGDVCVSVSSPVTLVWDPVPYSESYGVQLATHPSFLGGSIIYDEPTSKAMATVGGLAFSTRYYWRVVTITPFCAKTIQVASAVFETESQHPAGVPTLLTPSNGAVAQPTVGLLDWSDVPFASRYKVTIRCPGGKQVVSTSVPQSRYSYTLPEGTYEWSIRPYNSCNSTPGTSVAFTMTVGVGCDLVAPLLTAPADSARCQPQLLTLRWDPIPNVTDYIVRVRRNSHEQRPCDDKGDEVLVHTNQYEFAASEDHPGETYEWSVRDACPCSPFAACRRFETVGDSTDLRVPSPRSPEQGAANQPLSGKLEWRREPRASRYRLQVGQECELGATYDVDTTYFDYSGLSQSTTYCWRVATLDACGQSSEYSDCFHFGTMATEGIDRVFFGGGLLFQRGQSGIAIPVKAENLGGLLGAKMSLQLDPNVFEYVGVSSADTRSDGGVGIIPRYDPSGRLDVALAYAGNNECTPSIAPGIGDLFKVLVKVRPGAPLGTATLGFVDRAQFDICAAQRIRHVDAVPFDGRAAIADDTTRTTFGIDRVFFRRGLFFNQGQSGVEIPVGAENLGGLLNAQMTVQLDPEVFEYVGLSSVGTRSEGAVSITPRYDRNGRLNVSVAYSLDQGCLPSIPAGTGDLFKILANVRPTAPLGPVTLGFTDRVKFDTCGVQGPRYHVDAVPVDGRAVIRKDDTPVLSSLVSAEVDLLGIRLRWMIVGSTNAAVKIYRSEPGSYWREVGAVNPDGSGFATYYDRAVESGARYGYRVGVTDQAGEQFFGETWVTMPVTLTFALEGLRPNPADNEIVVSLSLPTSIPASIELVDLSGRVVVRREVVARPGSQTVSLKGGRALPSGIYLARLTQGGRSVTRKVCVVH